MKDGILFCLEGILTLVCKGLVLIIKTLNWLISFLAKILVFLIILVALALGQHFIETLPDFYQSVILFSMIYGEAFSFICIVALRLWKPEKFFRVFNSL